MKTLLIGPRDPLIVRDGKPIGGDASIETLPFPFPSTTAGAVRTRMASRNGEFLFAGNDAACEALRKVPVHGPILAEIDAEHEDRPVQYLFPAPRDATVFPKERDKNNRVTHVEVRALVPGKLGAEAQMDSLAQAGLRPIVSAKENTDKPFEKAPVFWTQREFLHWLETGRVSREVPALDELGVEGLPTETRVHVVIQPGERVAIDGGLFQTKGLRFAQGRFGKTRHFALSLRTEPGTVAGQQVDVRDELAPMGGERRLARWRTSKQDWPTLPEEIRQSVLTQKKARIVLLTPAMFCDGALPDMGQTLWALGDKRANIAGACVGRPVVVSGWDMTLGARGEKPTRRLAPAGSVYFVDLGEASPEAIDGWLERVWLQCVSDADQDRRDGFGLAMVGVWEEKR